MKRVRLFSQHVSPELLVLIALEAVIFVVAVLTGVWLTVWGPFAFSEITINISFATVWHRALLFAATMSMAMLAMGLYGQGHLRYGRPGVILRMLMAYALALVPLALIFYVLPQVYVGRRAMFMAMIISFLLILILRHFFSHTVTREIFSHNILVYGAGKQASRINRLVSSRGYSGSKIVGFVPVPHEPPAVGTERLLSIGQSLTRYVKDHGIDEILVALDERRQALPLDDLLYCRLAGVSVTDVPDFFERETGKIRLELITPSWVIFGSGFQVHQVYTVLKRVTDLAASAILLLVSLPIWLMTALAIKIEDGWGAPVLYRQVRVGLDDSTFEILKFRSMREGAEQEGEAKWAEEDDPRVTRVGTTIRKLRIDELPQLYNVVRGEMSLVGPRPERPEFVKDLARRIPYYAERHCVKPGVTGWAQLRYPYGASIKDAIEKLQYDLYYIKNHNPIFDLFILARTMEVILFGKGAR